MKDWRPTSIRRAIPDGWMSLSEQTPQVSVWREAGKQCPFAQWSVWSCGILWPVTAHALMRGVPDEPAELRCTVVGLGGYVMVAPSPPQELNISVEDRSTGSGARMERGLPGVLVFLVKEGRRSNVILGG
jgi:hypothetical protein